MILLTVGTQKPFDRLIRLADAWAEHHPNVNIYAQTCDGAAYIPRNMKHRAFLSKEEIDALSARATLIVSVPCACACGRKRSWATRPPRRSRRLDSTPKRWRSRPTRRHSP